MRNYGHGTPVSPVTGETGVRESGTRGVGFIAGNC